MAMKLNRQAEGTVSCI